MNGQIDKLYSDNSQKHQEAKALLIGILLGEKEMLTKEQVENFKISNLSHILAVSGMHMAYIIAGTLFILNIFNISKSIIHILIVVVIIFFMFLVGFTPSVVRASIMAIIALIAFLIRKKADIWTSISIASLISLLYNPYIFFSLSYQLSYLGTIGIVLGIRVVNVYEDKRNSHTQDEERELKTNEKNKIELKEERIANNKIKIRLNEIWKNKEKLKQLILNKSIKLKKAFINIIIVCISAQVFVSPIIVLNFNTVSVYFLLSNVLISFIIGIVIILGFIVIFISYICFPLASCLNYVENLLIDFINIMTKNISNLPNSIIYLKTPYIFFIIMYYSILLICIFIYTSKSIIVKRIVKKYLSFFVKGFIIFIIACLIVVLIIDFHIFEFNKTRIYFVDVGQGDCSLIITERNKKILIDGGGSNNYDVGKNITLPYLLDRRITALDYVIVSHFDSDHVQGLYAILEYIRVKNVVISKQYEITDNFKKFLNIIKEKKINLVVVKKGDVLQIDKYSKLEILFPYENLDEFIVENPINNNSIVCKYIDRRVSVLFTGDIEEIAEECLINLYKKTSKLKADILKVAHHGSKSSSTKGFLDLVEPSIALIGVSATNTFGHPNDEVLRRLESINSKIYRTDKAGEIYIEIKNAGKPYYFVSHAKFL